MKLIELNQIGKVMDKTLSSDKETKLKKLRLTNFEWKLGRKLGGSICETLLYQCNVCFFVVVVCLFDCLFACRSGKFQHSL